MAALGTAFAAGLISFLSPCVLPLVPSYLSVVSALEPAQFESKGAARRLVLSSIPFVFGFTTIFVALGILATSVAGLLSQRVLSEVSGFILIVMAFALVGLLPMPAGAVFAAPLRWSRRSGSRALFGAAFAVCAAPCIGPVLAATLVLASSSSALPRASVLLAAYSLGIAAPLIACGIAFARTMRGLRWLRNHYMVIQVLGGLVLGAVGVLLFFDRFWWLQVISNRLLEFLHLGGV